MSTRTNLHLHATRASDSPLSEHAMTIYPTLLDLVGGGDPAFTITATEGIEDGVPVIMIDTPGEGGHFRIVVNDSTIWDADPESHEHTRCACTHDQGEPTMSENAPLTKLVNIVVTRQQQTEVRVPIDFPVGDQVTPELLELIAANEADDTGTVSINTEVVSAPKEIVLTWTVTRPVTASFRLDELPDVTRQAILAGHRVNAAEIEEALQGSELAQRVDVGRLARVVTAQTILEG